MFSSLAETAGVATVSHYSKAYIAISLPGVINIVPKVTPAAGQVVTVTVTINANDVQSGAALPAFSESFDIAGPPLPQLATHIALLGGPDVLSLGGQPADPGSGTISI